jgi:NAD(P)-dependent dehydrogenase (short-subunit alcohol dehydrogenase family)
MRMSSEFYDEMRVCVFGGGGIGGALVEALADDPRVITICAGARNISAISAHQKVTPFAYDLLDETSIRDAAEALAPLGPFDVIIVATGILHEAEGVQPEKSYSAQTPEAYARLFAINATGPAIIAKHFLPLMARGRKAVFAALSARVGSISDNRLGGWHAYRASKAALNMIVRNFALELAHRNKSAIAVTLHPGTVATNLSAPFQSGVKPEKLFTADVSAGHLLRVIDGLTAADSGQCFDWQGQVIPF